MSGLQLRRRPAEIRQADEKGKQGVVIAYVSVFDVEYRVGPFGQREIIEAGAFDASIKDKPVVPFFWSHAWGSGLMVGDAEMSSDEHGLIATSTLDLDDDLGRRVFRRIASGAIDEFSIGYIPTSFKIDPDDEELERVTEAQLLESSAVVLGANPETEVIEVRGRQLVAPVLVAGADGAFEVQWVPTQVDSGDEPPPPDPAPVEEAYTLLREPAFRELMRERLSRPPVASGS